MARHFKDDQELSDADMRTLAVAGVCLWLVMACGLVALVRGLYMLVF